MTINKPIFFYTSFYFIIAALIATAQDPQGLSVGDKAPDIDASDQNRNIFNLANQLEKGPVVLFFYRGHWCKYCNRQLEELSDSIELIIEKGASVITVTPETSEYVDQTSEKFGNSFRIISDTDGKIMDDYRVKFQLSKATNIKYNLWGIHLDEYNGANSTNLPVPATYIIDQAGTIKYVFFNEDYKERVSVRTILDNL